MALDLMRSEVTIEGANEQKVDFIFDRMIVADFMFLNWFGGFAVTTTFNAKLVV